ncbi:MAG: hypothetical protein SFX73_28580 [Kofleriaceae bacterium]|nr:hypothetical protein [Kofleriaceae bacterium]
MTWREMVEQLGPDFGYWDGDYPVRLRAEFFDQAGLKATQTTGVTLVCESSSQQRYGVTEEGCVQGATCREGTFSGRFIKDCESWRERTTGEEMCQRAFGTSCRTCGWGSLDGGTLGCDDLYAGHACSCE